MNHLDPETILALLAGDLAPERRSAVEAHLDACRACRRLLDEHRDLDALLGAWRVDAKHTDVWPAIEARLDAADDDARGALRLHAFRAARIAASIVLGVGLGLGGARLARISPPPGSQTAVSAEQALAATGFEVLETSSATGLGIPWEETTDAQSHEEGES